MALMQTGGLQFDKGFSCEVAMMGKNFSNVVFSCISCDSDASFQCCPAGNARGDPDPAAGGEPGEKCDNSISSVDSTSAHQHTIVKVHTLTQHGGFFSTQCRWSALFSKLFCQTHSVPWHIMSVTDA